MKKDLVMVKKVLSKIIVSEKGEKYTPILFQPKKPKKLVDINDCNK